MAEPIYPPTYSCSAGTTSIPFALPMNVRGWTFDEVELVAKPLLCKATHAEAFEWTAVDDAFEAMIADVFDRNADVAPDVPDYSPAALITRLTSGDRDGQ